MSIRPEGSGASGHHDHMGENGNFDASKLELQPVADLLDTAAREEEEVLRSARTVSVPALEQVAEESFLRLARDRAPLRTGRTGPVGPASRARGVAPHLRRPGRLPWSLVAGRWNRWLLTLAALFLALVSIRVLGPDESPAPGRGQLGDGDVKILRSGLSAAGELVVEWDSTLSEVVFTVRIRNAETGEELYASAGLAEHRLELPSGALELDAWPAEVALEVEAITTSGQSVGFDEVHARLE